MGCSLQFRWFFSGLVTGWTIAAIGEEQFISPGTAIGGFVGAIIGLWIGTALAILPKPPVKPQPPNQDAASESN